MALLIIVINRIVLLLGLFANISLSMSQENQQHEDVNKTLFDVISHDSDVDITFKIPTLLERKADINIVNSGETPLFTAIFNNRSLHVIHTLLLHKAFIDKRYRWFTNHPTSLMLACSRGNEDLLRFLVESNADMERRDAYGKTVLMHAADQGKLFSVKFLVQAKADINAYDREKQTVLIHAARGKPNKLIIGYLLHHNANYAAKDSFGKTAYDHAGLLLESKRETFTRLMDHYNKAEDENVKNIHKILLDESQEALKKTEEILKVLKDSQNYLSYFSVEEFEHISSNSLLADN